MAESEIDMRTYLLNPPSSNDVKYIREGRCMQSKSSWATIWPPISLGILASIARTKGEVRFLDCNVEEMNLNAVLKERIDSFMSLAVTILEDDPQI